jgi:hypothetical protein
MISNRTIRKFLIASREPICQTQCEAIVRTIIDRYLTVDESEVLDVLASIVERTKEMHLKQAVSYAAKQLILFEQRHIPNRYHYQFLAIGTYK